jgi:hypothetical protein
MTARDRIVLVGIAVLAVVAGGWMLVVSPERKEARSIGSKVEAAKSTLATAQSQLANARAAQTKYTSAYSSVVSLGKAVPAGQEVPSLIYQLSQATGERDVEFNSISAAASSPSSATGSSTAAATTTGTASAAAASAGFTQMPFTFIFNGEFFALERLFSSLTAFTNHTSAGGLEVSGRLLTIQSVKLAPEGAAAPGKPPKLTGTITATAYVLPAGASVTGSATATSPTGASTPAASTSASASAATSPAVVKVTP